MLMNSLQFNLKQVNNSSMKMKSVDSSKLKTKSQYSPDSRGIREVIHVLCSKNQFNNGVDFKQRIGFSINLEE
ncbi:hypothetical protein HanPSC8_Chr15g0652931 [Helianthus annuus]|nr:hypothetical protein HanPSC8_Chr15g0652931 [Helianthus annuus]